MTYSEALSYLMSLNQFGYHPGLETTRRLSRVMGDPWRSLRSIHVAGTNGKGSVCAMLESIYRTAGYQTGLYTSPHLVRFGERIQVDRQLIPDEAVAEGTTAIRERMEALDGELKPTFFEFCTVLAWWWFEKQGCDLVILETGLGGRCDATNVVDPVVSVITQIGWDHMHVLGNSLAAIAAEKAGIIKKDVPVVTGVTAPDALAVVEYKAREMDAPLLVVDEAAARSLLYPVGLLGEHQRANAAVAATTVRLLRPLFPVDDEVIVEGLARVQWPGRFQIIQNGSQTLVLDGAHNRDGAGALRRTWAEHFGEVRPTLILGILNDKQWREMIREWMPMAGRVITTPVSSQRTVTADELLEVCRESRTPRAIRAASSVAEALRWAAADSTVLATGSLYLVGEMLEILDRIPSSGNAERSLNEWSPIPPKPHFP